MVEQATSRPLFAGRTTIRNAAPYAPAESLTPANPRRTMRLLRGSRAILRVQPLLAALGRRCGQAGEADTLAYFLATPDALKKTPYVLLIGHDDSSRTLDSAGEIAAAVLLFEYRALPGGSRVFASADGTGRRTILAPPDSRARVAALAARTLIQRGAQVVHLAFSETHRDSDSPEWPPAQPFAPPVGLAEQSIAAAFRLGRHRIAAEWALLEREIPVYLRLHASFDETLAHIGQRTRSNLRYYRRRAELDLGSRFVPNVRISLADFLAFNRACTYAVTDELARRRYEVVTGLPHCVLHGVRDGSGRWLSLVGMRRQGNRFAEIDWQMNRAALPAHSLATVMRAYLIEHEIAQGSTRLYIEGGTPQPIGRSFLKERVGELTVKRRSTYVGLLERFARVVCPPKNYLGQTLQNPELHWRPW